jgi:chemotaxis protein methyltransferase CheR
MKDESCINFLQWALPKLKLKWPGFRKVRKQACKRIGRRIAELNIADIDGYRAYLQENPDEWLKLDAMCRITISRFCRDRGLFDYLGSRFLPGLIQQAAQTGTRTIRCLCIGAASGEEPYSISLLWDLAGIPGSTELDFQIIATEIDPAMIGRAQKGCYPSSSIRELPEDWLAKAFEQKKDQYCLKQIYRQRVTFIEQDVRQSIPVGPYHLILCRNLVFTYFDNGLQTAILDHIAAQLLPGGSLVIGAHESLPENAAGLIQWDPNEGIFKKRIDQ